MKNELEKIKKQAVSEIKKCHDLIELDIISHNYLGKKGKVTEVLKGLGKLSDSDRPVVGKLANEIKNELNELVNERKLELEEKAQEEIIKKEKLDITLPGWKINYGNVHPIVKTLEEINEIFKKLGYSIAQGPDVETEYYNFESLNIPKDHPARDMWDTFFIRAESTEGRAQKEEGKLLLRTHTSPVQIRVMEKRKPPIKIIAPGRVYRRDNDISHSPEFYQVEGLLVDERTAFSDLKGTLEVFLHRFFGEERKVRFRPSFFPFTEPSAEVDVECIMCKGAGCRVCKNSC